MQRILIIVIIALAALLLVKGLSSGSSELDGDDTMRFVYYAMFAVLIGSGIFASRRNFGQAFRNLGLWALIILALVTAYVYRDDAQQIASRVTAGLIPGRAAVITDDNGFNTVVLYRGQGGHYLADAQIGTQTINMMVDTGASSIALSYEDAEKIGLNPQNLDFSYTVMTANGPARTAYATLPQISVGGIERTNVRAGIAERGKLGKSLLGMNFLGTLSSVSFSGDELKLRD
ncbi:MAG: Clan aspartic protease, family [Rhizobium sp.]|nr:Clan aspartic protease, family [Rhizobium sp.]